MCPGVTAGGCSWALNPSTLTWKQSLEPLFGTACAQQFAAGGWEKEHVYAWREATHLSVFTEPFMNWGLARHQEGGNRKIAFSPGGH